MIFKVNNGRHIQVSQIKPDGPVIVETFAPAGDNLNMAKEQNTNISPGDFVTMLNWYRYQKENGNINLNF